MPKTEAEHILLQQDILLYTIEYENSDTVPKDNVIRTNPAANSKIERTSRIMIYVSGGPAAIKLEDLKGKSLEEAQDILKKAGLEAAIEEKYDDAVPAGTVISQDPEAGADLLKGAPVKLVVSKGKDPASTPADKPEDKPADKPEDKPVVSNITVSLNANGGSVSPSALTIKAGSSYGSLPTPSRSGYIFNGWYNAASGGTKVSGSTNAGSKNHTLYARWTKQEAKSHTLTFNANGGYVSEASRTIKEGSTYGSLPTPSRTDYTFNGWYTAASGGSKVSSSTTMGTANVTIYAQWTQVIKAHTLSFNANGGSVSEGSRSVNEGAAYGTLPTPTRSGYTFNGWYTAASGGSKVSNTTTMGTANVTLYAHWTGVSVTYNVRYVSSNGTDLGSATVAHNFGSSYTVSAPAKTGYNTPAAQTVAWDSTSAKTITFTYIPTSVSASTTVTGNVWIKSGSTGLHYKVVIETRNRTANSIEFRATCTNTKDKGCYYGYTQKFRVASGSASTGDLTICDANKMGNSTTNQSVSASKASGWVKVTGLSPTTTSLSFSGKVWSASDSTTFSKSITIPTY